MDTSLFTREEIVKGLQRAKARRNSTTSPVRILFSPRKITDQNIVEVFETYSIVGEDDYDTVVVIESHPGSTEKKLLMPSFKSIKTPFGEVLANDQLRNDFCDEDDDFFINDDAFDEELSLHDQLLMLQCSLNSFSVLSLQIMDEGSFIVKELAFALEEILALKNALLVFCCDMENTRREELKQVLALYETENTPMLMNYLNSDESSVRGVGTFVAGLIVAQKWGLHLHFEAMVNDDADSSADYQSLLTGYANKQPQPVH